MAGNKNSGRKPLIRPSRESDLTKYLPKTPPLPGTQGRKKRAGKGDMSVYQFHRWLWEFVVAHNTHRLPADSPLRELGLTVDPFKIMATLKRNAALTKREEKQWERAMKAMNDLRALEEKVFAGETLTDAEKDRRSKLRNADKGKRITPRTPAPRYRRNLGDLPRTRQLFLTKPKATRKNKPGGGRPKRQDIPPTLTLDEAQTNDHRECDLPG